VEGRKGRAVFLDRDGVLNELVMRGGVGVSPRNVADFQLRREALDSVPRLHGLGFQVFVATNQPDIARGLLDPRDLRTMNTILQSALPVQEVLVCPHDDKDGCDCRKPKPGMLLDLARRWELVLSESFLVGDSWKDIEAGRRAGCRTILIGSRSPGTAVPTAAVADLATAVELIESSLSTWSV